MLTRDELIRSIRKLRTGGDADCYVEENRVDHFARMFGYENFSTLTAVVESCDAKNFIKISNLIVKSICQLRLPESIEPYYELEVRGDEIFFISVWIAQDGLNEVRGPRPMIGLIRAATLRARKEKFFVIENDYECGLWINIWHAKALIRSELARNLLHDFLVFSKSPNDRGDVKDKISVVYDIATEVKQLELKVSKITTSMSLDKVIRVFSEVNVLFQRRAGAVMANNDVVVEGVMRFNSWSYLDSEEIVDSYLRISFDDPDSTQYQEAITNVTKAMNEMIQKIKQQSSRK
ncbi:hypothetical protein DFS28_101331 [Pseudomonas sp. 478]|uniref:hypothetical protein n=1 Tax=unclassified Pseudomonas TaxID=196821 RepID=UPI000DAC39A5|nr:MULTISPECIES: hypothetical protein [unclassified Pseudomonas]PZX01981.1 hypothetical protein DFS28_101331 [Pseudomonas sp. 478]TCV52088.1 hypothetical protein EDB99_106125 [Pseudomonas sp. 460]